MNLTVGRPSLRELFFADKRIEVLFHTSNISKYLQARAVFERFGLQVSHFKGRTEPYSEEYDTGKEALLSKAIKQILTTVGRTAVFFVEDTSLRIDALSSNNDDIPGLAVKEWFNSTTFDELDRQLSIRQLGRRATVKSDIALHLPGLDRPIFFHGETSGIIANNPPDFKESIQYPWLTPNTFNGWFIPDGATKCLGAMSFEESWAYDFRVNAFIELIQRLEEYTAALNLPPQAYSRIEPSGHSLQLPLIPETRPTFLVIGCTCSGKSTFGEYASKFHELQWIEASGVVRMLWDKESESDRNNDINAFSEHIMNVHGADVVARKILSLIPKQPYKALVITGFRTLEELELFRKEISDVKIVLVEASERTRFERYLQRARPGAVKTFNEFRVIDQGQSRFGLLRVAEDFANVRVTNEWTLDDYKKQIDAVIAGQWAGKISGVSDQIHSARKSERSQLYRCLLALDMEGRALDCSEIEKVTGRSGTEIRFNNANKMLKRYPELARRLELKGERVRYQITDSGRTYLRLLKSEVEKIEEH